MVFFFAAVGIGIDVAAREITGSNIPWMTDAIEYGMAGACFAAAPWLLRHGKHISIDLLPTLLRPGPRRWLSAVASTCGFAVCLILFLVSLATVLESHARGSIIVKATHVPEWMLLMIVPIGIGLCAIEFLRRLLLALRRPEDRTT